MRSSAVCTASNIYTSVDTEAMMSWIAWICFGLAVGTLARSFVPRMQAREWVITTALAIAGAVLSGWAGDAISGHARAHGFSLSSIAMAIAGAALIVFVYHTTFRRTGHTTTQQLRTSSGDHSINVPHRS
jgi:uncharacterized membrane protein YeaQ/YmgE (transglycosylase-associated protein family)